MARRKQHNPPLVFQGPSGIVVRLNTSFSSLEPRDFIVQVLRQLSQVLCGFCVASGCGVVFFGHLGDVFHVLGDLGAD
jgi:ABC-type nitrate/sulfonate/bicarbonate transport system permease component